MTADRTDKVDPEQLELRARPRSVTRISRKVLYAGSALALALIAGAVRVALDPPNWTDGSRKELLETHRKQRPDGLEKLHEVIIKSINKIIRKICITCNMEEEMIID